MFFGRGRRAHHRRGPGGKGRFGARRPLRFLIERLSLDDPQAAELSKILSDLRLEREQAELDRKKASGSLADLMTADPLDVGAVRQAAEVRVTAAGRERDATVTAIERLHALLQPEQRVKLAMLVRSGPFAL
ncbi:MAG: periplasmic heavy metal sensor [Myxococcota bacterium]